MSAIVVLLFCCKMFPHPFSLSLPFSFFFPSRGNIERTCPAHGATRLVASSASQCRDALEPHKLAPLPLSLAAARGPAEPIRERGGGGEEASAEKLPPSPPFFRKAAQYIQRRKGKTGRGKITPCCTMPRPYHHPVRCSHTRIRTHTGSATRVACSEQRCRVNKRPIWPHLRHILTAIATGRMRAAYIRGRGEVRTSITRRTQ